MSIVRTPFNSKPVYDFFIIFFYFSILQIYNIALLSFLSAVVAFGEAVSLTAVAQFLLLRWKTGGCPVRIRGFAWLALRVI